MSEPRQFRRDPATGDFAEDSPDTSHPPAWVCPNPVCQAVTCGPRCVRCGWTPPDDDEPDAPTDLDSPDLGGSD